MTLFGSFLQSLKDKWIKSQEDNLRNEYSERLSSIESELQSEIDNLISEKKKIIDSVNLEKSEIESLEKRMQDTRSSLQEAQRDLKEHLKVLEAKANPSIVWQSAYTAGFQAAWSVAWDFQKDAFNAYTEKVRSQAINDTLKRLNGDLLPQDK